MTWHAMPDYDTYETAREAFEWALPDAYNPAVDCPKKREDPGPADRLALIDAATDERFTYHDIDADDRLGDRVHLRLDRPAEGRSARSRDVGRPRRRGVHLLRRDSRRRRRHVDAGGLGASIRERAREHLAAYEYPREIEFADESPMTSSGKIRRVELRDRDGGQ